MRLNPPEANTSSSTLAVALAALVALAQSNAQPFAGTWTFTFRGDAAARLELQTTPDGLTGRISLGSWHVDGQGEIDEVLSPATTFTPIFDVALRDGVLSFARKDDDDTDRFEMRVNVGGVNSADTARLTLLITDELRQRLKDEGIAAPRPVTLTRTQR